MWDVKRTKVFVFCNPAVLAPEWDDLCILLSLTAATPLRLLLWLVYMCLFFSGYRLNPVLFRLVCNPSFSVVATRCSFGFLRLLRILWIGVGCVSLLNVMVLGTSAVSSLANSLLMSYCLASTPPVKAETSTSSVSSRLSLFFSFCSFTLPVFFYYNGEFLWLRRMGEDCCL